MVWFCNSTKFRINVLNLDINFHTWSKTKQKQKSAPKLVKSEEKKILIEKVLSTNLKN